MSITDWKMQEEWKNELDQKEQGKQTNKRIIDPITGEWKGDLVSRRIQKPEYLQNNDQPLTPISTLKQLKSKQYDEALRKIDFHIKANFLNGDKVSIYQALLPDNVKIDDNELHERIKKQGYTLKVVYGLVGEVDCLEISGW